VTKNRYIQIDDLRNDNLIKYTDDDNGTFVEPSDVIIAWDGANAGTIGYGLEGLIGSTLARLKVIIPHIDTNYLGRFLQSKFIEIRNNCTGATIPHVSKVHLNSLQVPVPPLPIQKQIAAVLEKADTLRQQSQQMEQELNSLAQSVFLDMFGDPGINPKKWPLRPIGSTFKSLTDYHANGSYEILRSHVELFDEPNYALMVRTTDLEKNNFSQNVKYISKDAYYFLNKTKVFGNELIVNKIGSAGKVYLMPELDRPVSLAMNQFMVRLKEDIVLPEFMYYLLTSKFGEREIQAHVKGAVTKTITKDALRSVELPIPPLELQQKFVSTLLHLKGLIRCSSDNNICKDELFNSLMQRAFKGELDLKDVA
jgi:type I restriction enzyme S subunit